MDLKDSLRIRLGDGEFNGYILAAMSKLRKRLPIGSELYDWEILRSYMYEWTLEAIDVYNPSPGKSGRVAKFETVLTKHLQIRSLQYFNWSWLKKNQPEGRSVWCFSSYETPGEGVFDPTFVKTREVSVELAELLDSLSPKSRMIMKFLSGLLGEDLLNAFASSDYYNQVSVMTGLDSSEVILFVKEIKDVAKKTISSLGP